MGDIYSELYVLSLRLRVLSYQLRFTDYMCNVTDDCDLPGAMIDLTSDNLLSLSMDVERLLKQHDDQIIARQHKRTE